VFLSASGGLNDGCWRAPCKGGVFPVGERPTRVSLQPEAIGAVMEVAKWLVAESERLRSLKKRASHLNDLVISARKGANAMIA